MVKSNEVINIYLPKNNAIFISIISIFIAFSAVLYFKPSMFVFAFHTILGNLIIVSLLAFIWFLDKKLSISFGLLLAIIYLSSKIMSSTGTGTVVESFDNPEWPQQTIDDFNAFQQSRNPNVQYDVNILQKQATLDEVNELFETGKWPWSENVRQMYLKSIASSSNISIDPEIALTDAQTIYNENAIKQVLAWGAKEGIFLIHGATIGHPKGMPDNINNLVRCGTSKDGSPVMQKIQYLGYNGINGSMDENIIEIKNSEIPKEVSGFSFIKSECNPCIALSDVPDYSCPFKINTGNGTEVSDVWKDLWGLGGTSANSESNGKKNEFPVLSKLRDELNKASFGDFHFSDSTDSADPVIDDADSADAVIDDAVIDDSQDALLSSDNTQEIGENDYDTWVPSFSEGGLRGM